MFTAIARRRLGGPLLTVPNVLTLSRAGAAAMACGTAFSGRGRRAALVALLLGCTVFDWLDGPLARLRGPTRLGAVLDLESDSWLTLWGAIAGVRLGGLPTVSLLPPVLRYPLAAGHDGSGQPWQRAAGVTQMVVIAWSLTRRPPPRAVTMAAAAAQLAALTTGAIGYRWRDGPAPRPLRPPCVGDAEADRPLREPVA